MFYKKSGVPEQGEIVICTVTKILYHSVFAKLDEYKNLDGMIHISEISPGRIRNIRDYVKEGKKIVCKVLSVRRDKNQIDISIRRVNTMQRVNKINDHKQEQKAEKLLEYIGKQLKKDLKTMYAEAGFKLIETYGGIYDAFQRFVLDEEAIKDLKLEKETEKLILEIVKDKIKAPEVEIKGTLKLISEKPNGIEIIKKILIDAQKGDIKISYVSAPKYSVSVKASDYKTAEGILKNAQEEIIEQIEQKEGHGEFKRE
ncbi:translation initiation factor IF-2 subunit alpha [Candidatus Woesearchaeota archaeon]|jgi:translation initiation factor 2 subunit 1|nr:translation initiation factor IF-2 subunit alpha [Candidatus Woesearchaeota archaeon]MBT7237858.1 translation initiation factor IF-2 subunit alpha [Candidatus Woesearchaeota archaeon]